MSKITHALLTDVTTAVSGATQINDTTVSTGSTYSSSKITTITGDLGNLDTPVYNNLVSAINSVHYSVAAKTSIDDSNLSSETAFSSNKINELYLEIYDSIDAISASNGSSNGTSNRSYKVGIGTTGNTSTFEADGTDTDINLNLKVKGAGKIKLDGANYVTAQEKFLTLNSSGEVVATNNLTSYMAAASLGNIVYVSPAGNDSTGMRGRIDKPFATIQGAFDSVNGTQQYDILHVMSGTYTGDFSPFGARSWSTGFGVTIVLDNATIIGNLSMPAGIGGDLGYSIIGVGVSKIVGTVGLGHSDHTAKNIFNVEVTNGIKTKVTGKVSGCKIIYETEQLFFVSGLWENTEIICTYTNGLGVPWANTVSEGMRFVRCNFKVNHFGTQIIGATGGGLILENCTITGTDDTKHLFTWNGQGIKIFARNCTFNSGKKLYQAREDNGYNVEESFYFQNCNFFSRTDSSLIAKYSGASPVGGQLEVINCVANVSLGATPTVSANFVQASFTNF